MDILILISLIIASFLAGFLDGIAGGGGLILVPSLLVAGIAPQFALGTNKFIATFGNITSLVNFIREKKVIWKIALIGIVFSLIGSVAGTEAVLLIEQKTAAKIILVLLPIAAVLTFIPKSHLKTSESGFSKSNLYIHVPLICTALGFYDGFFGPGTGTFLIIAFYVFLGMDMVNASAIAKVFNLASTAISFVAFALAGKIIYLVGIPAAAANLAGGYLGSRLAIKKGQRVIKAFILIAFGLLFATLIVKYLK